MNSFLDSIPKNLADQAYIYESEAAWPKDDALSVIAFLSQLGIAIYGGEVWLATQPGPTIPTPYIYVWDIGSRNEGESWDVFVIRANQAAREYISSFEWDEKDAEHSNLVPYFNFTVSEQQPRQMNDLEKQLLDKLLDGDEPFLVSLRKQIELSVIESRVLTGSGFFVYFSVPDSVPRIGTGRILVDDVQFDLEGLKHGGEIILFVDDGHISIFEGYLHAEDWPEEAGLTNVRYDTNPRDFELLRKAWHQE
ncbi:MAG: Imm40 family immunity protein [Thermoleophilia bacterium]